MLASMVRSLGAVAALVVVTVAQASPDPGAGRRTATVAPATKVIKIVQLGDSYSSGNGAGHYTGPKGCYRSTANWGALYEKYLDGSGYSATYVNVACNGGVIKDITHARVLDPVSVQAVVPKGSKPGSATVTKALTKACLTKPEEERAKFTNISVHTLPRSSTVVASATCTRSLRPQIDSVGEDTDLVLMTAGGNDVYFDKIVEECFAVFYRSPEKCRDRIDYANDHIGQVTTDLKAALLALHGKRKDLKVVLLTYPYLSKRSSWVLRSVARKVTRTWGDSYDAGANVRTLGDNGDQAQRDAVQQANAEAGADFVTLVDKVKAHFAGREPDPAATNKNADGWIHEFTLTRAESYHPNSKGHQEEANLLTPYGDFGAAHSSGQPQGSVDLAFVIDTTGSMQPSLDAVKELSSSMVNLLVGQTNSYRFALVTYRDQPEWTLLAEDYAARVDLNFTTNTGLIHSAIGAMQADAGGDVPESIYSGLQAAFDLSWRPGVKKVVIQIGDAPPHDPEPVSGLTADAIAQGSLALDPVEVYPIDVSGFGLPGPELTGIARRTGGVTQAAGADDLGSTLIRTITKALHKPYAWLGGPYVAKVGESVLLDARGSFDTDGTITKYAWDFDGNGKYEQTTTSAQLKHVWKTPITGTVAVRVTDNDGESTVATAYLAITVDGDEITDAVDNCPKVANPGQEDTDGDGQGDECDPTPGLPTADAEGVFPADDPSSVSISTISGVVYLDEDGDGYRGPSEPGLSGTRIVLSGAEAGGAAVARETTTDQLGAWTFTGLIPGTYQVVDTQPDGLADGEVTIGSIRNGGAQASAGTREGDTVRDIILDGVGSAAVDYAFGERRPSAGPGLLTYVLFGLVGLALLGGAGTAVVVVRRRRAIAAATMPTPGTWTDNPSTLDI